MIMHTSKELIQMFQENNPDLDIEFTTEIWLMLQADLKNFTQPLSEDMKNTILKMASSYPKLDDTIQGENKCVGLVKKTRAMIFVKVVKV